MAYCSGSNVNADLSHVELTARRGSWCKGTRHSPDTASLCQSCSSFHIESSASCSLPAALVRACAVEPDVFMLSSAPPVLPEQPPQPSGGKSAAAASPDASWEGDANPGGGGADSGESAQDAGQPNGNGGEPQLVGGRDGGTAFSWDSDAVAAADPFAAVHAPDRLFRLSAAPADVLGLQQCSDGKLQLADGDVSDSRTVASSDAAQQLLRQLAAAVAAPSWPPGSIGTVDASPGARNPAGAIAGRIAGVPDNENPMYDSQLPRTAFLKAATAKPGTGTSWGDEGPAEREVTARQQEAAAVDPAAPSTPQRGAEHRSHVHTSSAAGPAATAGSDAQGAVGSPLPMRVLSTQSAADNAAGSPAADAEVQLVKVDEAALVQTALLALQVTICETCM